MPAPLARTTYDGFEETDNRKMVNDQMVKVNDPYKIQPEFQKGRYKIRKNQIISQERAKRAREIDTSSSTATFSTGLWGATFEQKNVFEGCNNRVLQWPYTEVEGAKAINVFGKKNRQLSLKAQAENAKNEIKEEVGEKEKAAYAICALPNASALSSAHENFGEYEPPKKLTKEDKDFVNVKSELIPLGMRNLAREKAEAFKKEQDRVQKLSMNFKPKTSQNTYNPSQDGKAKPKVFMDLKVGSAIVGQIIIELRGDICPVTVKNFRAITCNERGFTYQGTKFHRVIPKFMLQGGDFTRGDGTGGYSIYGPRFKDENFTLKHDEPFVLSMANSGPNTNGSQFFITTEKCPWLDDKHVVFGKVIEGQKVVREVERQGSSSGKPRQPCTIYRCGDVDEMTDSDRAKWNAEKEKQAKIKAAGGDPTAVMSASTNGKQESKELSKREKLQQEHINRLTKVGAKYLNLNPWRVLELDHLATDSDVKKAYKKLSLLCHPDRNRDNTELAQRAFDALKKANEILMDTKRKEECLSVLQEARERVMRQLVKEKEKAKKQARVEKRDIKVELAIKENFERTVEKESTKLFADLDMAYRERIEREQARKAAEMQMENEQLEYANMCKEYNKNFNASRQQRVDSWYKFEKARTGKKGKTKITKYKVGTFKPPRKKQEKR